ncbi:ATP-binding protein [Plantibacter sp. YIM 135347]|uniref:sensor histidine kinase n=1 Tax=Plantibacter sp. YIM 135347 TaxID=3423919 RepID=UPI003D333B2C
MRFGELQHVFQNTRVRILAAILLATTLAMVLAGFSAYVMEREQTVAAIDADLTRTAEATAFVVAGSGDSSTAPTTTAEAVALVLKRSSFGADEGAVGLLPGAEPIAPSSPTGFRLDGDDRLIATFSSEATGATVLGTATTHGATVRDIRYAVIPVTVVGDPAVGHIVVATDLTAALDAVGEVFRVYVIVAVISLLLIGLVGWRLAGRLLHPIRLLRDTAARITESDLDERIPVIGKDDVSQLTSTVNDMLDRLDDAFTSQRQLLDDVGHELKTPITIVRGHLELLDPADPVEVAATRELALDELDRMSTLVGDIAELSAAGAGATLQRVPTDVADLTMAVLDKAAAISPVHRWELGERAELIVGVDPARMAQAWLQLADNAAKYSPVGSTITISSRFEDGSSGGSSDGSSDGGPDGDPGGGSDAGTDDSTDELGGSGVPVIGPDPQLVLSVSDQGPGVPEDLRERIFDRFTRAQEGRGVRGSGLGLAIVQAIAEAHGGWAQMDEGDGNVGNGSVFSIRLPLEVDPTDDEDFDTPDDEQDPAIEPQDPTSGPPLPGGTIDAMPQHARDEAPTPTGPAHAVPAAPVPVAHASGPAAPAPSAPSSSAAPASPPALAGPPPHTAPPAHTSPPARTDPPPYRAPVPRPYSAGPFNDDDFPPLVDTGRPWSAGPTIPVTQTAPKRSAAEPPVPDQRSSGVQSANPPAPDDLNPGRVDADRPDQARPDQARPDPARPDPERTDPDRTDPGGTP